MTYQSFYRKYRSQTFSDLVGQESVIRALRGAITSGRVSHAYLFSGTRGTGKTSTARLLAKAINCTGRAPEIAEPCNACPSCLAMAAGTALDLIEIDAASNRGIDEIRELRDKVNLAPAQVGGKKVYIIDEAHMLTAEAFNALLKTLEEPPEHAVFILCTTEATRIPATVLGRCQQFQFRRFTDAQIVGRLRHIAEREEVAVEDGALAVIANVAQGTMRDAVGLLDQLVPLADGPITEVAARDLLGMTDPARIAELLDLVLAGSAGAALQALGQLYAAGAELRQVVRGLMERCRDELVAAIDRRDARARARLSAVLDGLLHLDGEIRRHAEPRLLVEATVVRLAVEVGAGEAPPV
ncbi:MAG: DNA polymerase III subunit gamma/tau, partial [Candidatus Dormiibacterota bacterium]